MPLQRLPEGGMPSVIFLFVQVFVANPNKPQPIVDILTNNRDKLLKFLEEFHADRGEST